MSLIYIRLKSFDKWLLDRSTKSIVEVVKKIAPLDSISGPIPIPCRISRFTVNRAHHIHKKSREQFEIRVYKRLIALKNVGSQIVQMLNKDLQLPAGVSVKIQY